MDKTCAPTNRFVMELAQLINSHSLENGSDTPDFVIAQYLCQCLNNYNSTIQNREILKEK